MQIPSYELFEHVKHQCVDFNFLKRKEGRNPLLSIQNLKQHRFITNLKISVSSPTSLNVLRGTSNIGFTLSLTTGGFFGLNPNLGAFRASRAASEGADWAVKVPPSPTLSAAARKERFLPAAGEETLLTRFAVAPRDNNRKPEAAAVWRAGPTAMTGVR